MWEQEFGNLRSHKSPKKGLTECVSVSSCTYPSQPSREHHCLCFYLQGKHMDTMGLI